MTLQLKRPYSSSAMLFQFVNSFQVRTETKYMHLTVEFQGMQRTASFAVLSQVVFYGL
jgi:hypothetical protein